MSACLVRIIRLTDAHPEAHYLNNREIPYGPVIDRGRPRTVFRAYEIPGTVHPGSRTTAQGPRPPFQQQD